MARFYSIRAEPPFNLQLCMGHPLKAYLDKVGAALRERGVKTDTLVRGSGAAQTIVSVAETEGADLIVMATMGQGSFTRRMMIGSVAYSVVRSTPCPVLLVPVRKSSNQ